jgi:hypothetical protein
MKLSDFSGVWQVFHEDHKIDRVHWGGLHADGSQTLWLVIGKEPDRTIEYNIRFPSSTVLVAGEVEL